MGMTNQSNAVRPHIGLASTDLHASVRFYTSLLGVEPDKLRRGYARFAPSTPALHLSLNQADRAMASRQPEHFGIQVGTRRQVDAVRARLQRDGYATREEEQVTCCYAVQDKFWSEDPDGHAWEVFVTTDDDAGPRAPDECCTT